MKEDHGYFITSGIMKVYEMSDPVKIRESKRQSLLFIGPFLLKVKQGRFLQSVFPRA